MFVVFSYKETDWFGNISWLHQDKSTPVSSLLTKVDFNI